MFGYVKPHVPSLTVADYEVYRGTYCGLCRAMGAVTGQVSRMSLSYDFAFLALFRMALHKVPSGFDRRGCIAHPFSKRFMMRENPELLYAAAASAVLTLEKIKDNIADEKSVKRLAAKLILPSGKAAVRRLHGDFDALRESVEGHLARLSEIEKNNTASIDSPADAFADALGEVFAFGCEGDDVRIAREVGRCLGKIVYVLDAADDLFDDIKSEKYNPIALIYEDPFEKGEENSKRPSLKADIAGSLSTAVGLELSRARSAFTLVDTSGFGTYERIVTNILTAGITAEARRVFFGDGTSEDPLKRRF